MDEILKMRERRAEALREAQAIFDAAKAETRETTDEEEARVDALMAEAKQLESAIVEAEAARERKLAKAATVGQQYAALTAIQPRRANLTIQGRELPPVTEVFDVLKLKRSGTVKNFVGRTREEAMTKAYRFGRWFQAISAASFGKSCSAIEWCRINGLDIMATSHEEGNNYLGGYLVPEEFDNDMIDLREQYGVFRRNARVVPMLSDTKSRPRRTGGLTAYFVGEGGTGTVSNKTWDRVTLVAKKLMVIVTNTVELSEDIAINLGDDLAGEIAYAFASKEDNCGFEGDGTSTYGGMTGVRTALGSAGKKSATSGSATAWSSITAGDMGGVIGLLPQYADTPNVRWYCHKAFYGNVMQRLAYAAGGNTTGDMAAGFPRMFMGYPVEISQVFPSTATAAMVVCLLGDLRLAADLGDRRGTTIEVSRDATVGSVGMFETDQVAIKGTERFDIVAHDVGDSSNAGPIVGLLTAS